MTEDEMRQHAKTQEISDKIYQIIKDNVTSMDDLVAAVFAMTVLLGHLIPKIYPGDLPAQSKTVGVVAEGVWHEVERNSYSAEGTLQ